MPNGPTHRRTDLVSSEFSLNAIRHPDAAQRLAAHDAAVRVQLAKTLYLDAVARLIIAIREGGLTHSLVEPDPWPIGTLERLFMPLLLPSVSRPVQRRG